MTPTIAEIRAAPRTCATLSVLPDATADEPRPRWDPWGLDAPAVERSGSIAGCRPSASLPIVGRGRLRGHRLTDGTFGAGHDSQTRRRSPQRHRTTSVGVPSAGRRAGVWPPQKLWNMTVGAAGQQSPSGRPGVVLPSQVSAVEDLAPRGSLQGARSRRALPSSTSMVGGPARTAARCYATGNDLDDLRDRGFEAFKLACPVGSRRGHRPGSRRPSLPSAPKRPLANWGVDADIMFDCWPVLDAAYAVRLGEAMRPYRLTWIEDYAQPDLALQVRLRPTSDGACLRRMLAAGERWYTDRTFAHAAEQRLVDVVQPDVQWVARRHRRPQDRRHRGREPASLLALHDRCQRLLAGHAPLPTGCRRQSLGGRMFVGCAPRGVADGRLAFHARRWPCRRTAVGISPQRRDPRLRHRTDPRPTGRRRRLKRPTGDRPATRSSGRSSGVYHPKPTRRITATRSRCRAGELAAVEAVSGVLGCQFAGLRCRVGELAAVEAVLGVVGCQFAGRPG